ncbi:H-NS family nucleoid-associated regulatory protein [Pantoea sp. MBLJ3]|uniref:H-NS family nucleoid-associated regulatory protein n=1 Tax=Pantoea sp. MBLJ3 TaxID=1562889 RepID=UPI00057FFF6C|nr:H-NS family nucleoid-associated regulatory protein [Pantoea sp. MBLJ3]
MTINLETTKSYIDSLPFESAEKYVAALQKHLESIKEQKKLEAIEKAKEILREAGISLDDLTGKKQETEKPKQNRKPSEKIAFIYKGKDYELSSGGRTTPEVQGLFKIFRVEKKKELIEMIKAKKAEGVTDFRIVQ